MMSRSTEVARLARRAGALALVLGAGLAVAQPADRPAPPPADAPLGGPRVERDRPPVNEEGFGGNPDRRRGGDRGLPMREFTEIIDQLRGEKAPANLRLTPEQEKTLAQLREDFQRRAEENRRAARERREEPGMDGMQGEPARGREARREMRADAPRPSDMQTKVWDVLTPEQRAFAKERIDQARERLEHQREQEALRRRAGQGKAGPGPDARPPQGGAPGERGMRVMERLRNLPPEERERIMRMLEAELDKVAPEGGDRPRPPGGPGGAGGPGGPGERRGPGGPPPR